MPIHLKWEEAPQKHKLHLVNELEIVGKAGFREKVKKVGLLELVLPNKDHLVFSDKEVRKLIPYLKDFLARNN